MRRLALVALALAPLASAQTIVPITSTSIDPYVQAASPGDVLLLQGTVHTIGVPIDKGITLIGPAQLRPVPSGLGAISIVPPPTERARFVDVTFAASTITYTGFATVSIATTNSNVTFERCSCDGTSSWATVYIDGGNVLVDRCTFTVMSVATHNANVQVLSSSLSGREVRVMVIAGATAWWWATPALSVEGGTLQVSDSTFVAGPGNPALVASSGSLYLGKPGLEVTAGSAWITDSTITGSGAGTYPGAPALAGSTCAHARCTLTGGPGFPPGPASSGAVVPDPLLLGANETPSLTLGAPYTMTVTADQSGVPIVIALIDDVLAVTPLPDTLIAQPLWHGNGAIDVVAGGVSGANNMFSLSFPIPAATSLRYAHVALLGVRVAGLPLQLSPLCGGVIR